MITDEDDVMELIINEPDIEEKLLLAFVSSSKSKRTCLRDYLETIIPLYSENEFITHFPIKSSLFESLSEKFEASHFYADLRRDKRSSAHKHTAVFLWFAGHEVRSFRDLADRFDLSSSDSRIIDRYIMFLSSLSSSIITWPNDEQKQETSTFFQNKVGFSKAIGCIDGTHIEIDPPKCKDDYIDRKGNVSICLQAICNEKKKFISIFVGYPGSCHDSWVLQNSPIYGKLSESCGDYYVLGDSAYPCSSQLITPYRDNGHLTNEQKNFNLKLSSCRVEIEHSFGILKQRFRQLYYCKLRGVKKICHFIRPCCVLHNIANEDDLDFIEETIVNSSPDFVQFREYARGNVVRDTICQ